MGPKRGGKSGGKFRGNKGGKGGPPKKQVKVGSAGKPKSVVKGTNRLHGDARPLRKIIKSPYALDENSESEDEEIRLTKDDKEFFAEASNSKFLQDLDRTQISKQARFDADPTKLKGKIDRDAFAANGHDDEDDDDEDEGSEMDGDEDMEAAYERKLPAANASREEKQKLPIKLASGKLVQPTFKFEEKEEEDNGEDAIETDEGDENEDEEEEDEDGGEEDEEVEVKRIKFEEMTYAEREMYHSGMKEKLAELANQILENPEERVGLLAQFQSIFEEPSGIVRRYCLLTQFAIFIDILPGYAIRDLTEEEKETKVSTDVKKLRKYEESLLVHYQAFLQQLESILQDFRRIRRQDNKSKRRGDDEGGFDSEIVESEKIAITANKCMCDLLVRNPAFNFGRNLIASVVPRMCVQLPVQISETACEAVVSIFKNDNHGEPSLEIMRLIAQLLKARSYNVPAKVIDTLCHLRLLQEMEPPEMDPTAQHKKGKKPFVNKKKKKLMREEKELQRDLKEAEAEYSKEEKQKLHTQTLKIVFHLYFRILKNLGKPELLTCALRGLGKFAHLISIEFFGDIMNVFKHAITNGNMDVPTSVQCILTGYEIVSGQGESLTLDMKDFSLLLYKLLYSVMEGNGEHVPVAIQCLDHLIIKKKQLSAERVAGYAKRLSTICLQLPSHAALASLAMVGIILQRYPKTQSLLESEHSGMGTYLWDVDDPDLSHAFETSLWELHLLKTHYHPVLAKTASLLARGELGVTKTPTEIFTQFDFSDGRLAPLPQFPKPHPLAKAQRREISFQAKSDNPSPFLADLELKSHIDEAAFSRAAREHFATWKGFEELSELQREEGYLSLFIEKMKAHQNKKRKQPAGADHRPQQPKKAKSA